jgi:hypothetical protein
MPKRIKIIITTFLFVFSIFILPINTFASYYEEIKVEVEALVDEGKLPEYHKKLSSNTGYQTLYTKMYRQASAGTKEYFASMDYSNLLYFIQMYENSWNTVWYDILTNLDIEPKYLDPNRILGLYYDAYAGDESSYLYLVWTSKYLPSEFMTINSLELNGKEYTQYPTNDLFSPSWFDSKYYYFEAYDLAIHLTPIGGFDGGKEFGVPLTQKYKFSNIKTGIDKLQFDDDPDPNNLYSATIDSYTEFDLGIVPKYHEKSACQLVTHAYKLIKDCEVQSYYDFGFGGYMHYVHFNTTIPIDKIYRVDVSYVLTSDNKEWYQFWLNEELKKVTKSLRPVKKSTGIFNLYQTYGFKEGIFKSNEKESITYKYEMMLNYSEQNWDIFSDACVESNYKRIKDFQILRLNYLVEDEVYDVKVTMDNVDGKTLSIIDRELILDTESALWQIKDKTYNILDGFSVAKNVLISVLGIIGFLLLFYFGYKVVITVKEVMRDEK